MSKYKKDIQKIVKGNNVDKISYAKKELLQKIKDEKWDEALAKLAELIEKGCREPELFFMGAKAYYMKGDMERAAAWVDNTLRFMPEHIDARLLLAKLCLLEDRLDDAMSIYAFLLGEFTHQLTEQHKKEICNGIDGAFITDDNWLENEYPQVYNFYIRREENKDTDEAENVLQKNTNDAFRIIDEIEEKKVSIAEKVRLLNAFAAGFFISNDWDNTEELLSEALHLDEFSDMTIRNMTMLQKKKGDQEKAMLYAGRLSCPEFVLLQEIMR